MDGSFSILLVSTFKYPRSISVAFSCQAIIVSLEQAITGQIVGVISKIFSFWISSELFIAITNGFPSLLAPITINCCLQIVAEVDKRGRRAIFSKDNEVFNLKTNVSLFAAEFIKM